MTRMTRMPQAVVAFVLAWGRPRTIGQGGLRLPPRMKAKETSVNYAKFVERHGEDVFELEVLPPKALQNALRDAVKSVIDINLLNQELAREREEHTFLENTRRRVQAALAGELDMEGGDE